MIKEIRICVIAFLLAFLTIGFCIPSQSQGMIYVSNFSDGTVTVFPLNADNNVAPTSTISYSGSPYLGNPAGIAVDASWIYVADDHSNSILVFPIDANGDVAPTRRIFCSSFQHLAGIAVDANWIYVVEVFSPPQVMIFPIDADGTVTPSRQISGTNTTFLGPYKIAVDASWMYVADVFASRIDVFPVDGNGNIAPTRWITSGLDAPTAIDIDAK